MFYSPFILAKRGPLATIWIAAHLERKLRKNQVYETNISVSVDSILFPEVPIALRLSGHLLLGVVRIYSKKVGYLYADCSDTLVKIKQAFNTGAVDLPPDATTAPFHSITIPENYNLEMLELPDLSAIGPSRSEAELYATRERITLQEAEIDDYFYDSQMIRDNELFEEVPERDELLLEMEKHEAGGESLETTLQAERAAEVLMEAMGQEVQTETLHEEHAPQMDTTMEEGHVEETEEREREDIGVSGLLPEQQIGEAEEIPVVEETQERMEAERETEVEVATEALRTEETVNEPLPGSVLQAEGVAVQLEFARGEEGARLEEVQFQAEAELLPQGAEEEEVPDVEKLRSVAEEIAEAPQEVELFAKASEELRAATPAHVEEEAVPLRERESLATPSIGRGGALLPDILATPLDAHTGDILARTPVGPDMETPEIAVQATPELPRAPSPPPPPPRPPHRDTSAPPVAGGLPPRPPRKRKAMVDASTVLPSEVMRQQLVDTSDIRRVRRRTARFQEPRRPLALGADIFDHLAVQGLPDKIVSLYNRIHGADGARVPQKEAEGVRRTPLQIDEEQPHEEDFDVRATEELPAGITPIEGRDERALSDAQQPAMEVDERISGQGAEMVEPQAAGGEMGLREMEESRPVEFTEAVAEGVIARDSLEDVVMEEAGESVAKVADVELQIREQPEMPAIAESGAAEVDTELREEATAEAIAEAVVVEDERTLRRVEVLVERVEDVPATVQNVPAGELPDVNVNVEAVPASPAIQSGMASPLLPFCIFRVAESSCVYWVWSCSTDRLTTGNSLVALYVWVGTHLLPEEGDPFPTDTDVLPAVEVDWAAMEGLEGPASVATPQPPPPTETAENTGEAAAYAEGLNFLGDAADAGTIESDEGAFQPSSQRGEKDGSWSLRTRDVGQYLQKTFDGLGGQTYPPSAGEVSPPQLSMDNMVTGKTRKEAARMFFETLVLATRDYIHVEQSEAYGEILIAARPRLMKASF